MSNIVQRLRERATDSRDRMKPFNLLLDAAEEIERLQRELADLRDMTTDKARAWDALAASRKRARRQAFIDAAEIAEGYMQQPVPAMSAEWACNEIAAALRKAAETE